MPMQRPGAPQMWRSFSRGSSACVIEGESEERRDWDCVNPSMGGEVAKWSGVDRSDGESVQERDGDSVDSSMLSDVGRG